MFLAVSNFAAAPTGASLITKFLKQPTCIALPQQEATTGMQHHPRQRGQGPPGNALDLRGPPGGTLDSTKLHAGCQSEAPAATTELGEQTLQAHLQLSPSKGQAPRLGHGAAVNEQSTTAEMPVLQGRAHRLTNAMLNSVAASASTQPSAVSLQQPATLVSTGFAGLAPALHNQAAAQSQAAKRHVQLQESTMQSAQVTSCSAALMHVTAAAAALRTHHDVIDSRSAATAAREDSDGAANHPDQTPAADGNRAGDVAPGPANQGSCKRPLEQVFAKEPEHRKKPARCDISLIE